MDVCCCCYHWRFCLKKAENVLLQQQPPRIPPLNDTPEFEKAANGDDLNISWVLLKTLFWFPKHQYLWNQEKRAKEFNTKILLTWKLNPNKKEWNWDGVRHGKEFVMEGEGDVVCTYCNGFILKRTSAIYGFGVKHVRNWQIRLVHFGHFAKRKKNSIFPYIRQ